VVGSTSKSRDERPPGTPNSGGTTVPHGETVSHLSNERAPGTPNSMYDCLLVAVVVELKCLRLR
jgi:hypothetical protein